MKKWILLLVTFWSVDASASPWTLQRGRLLLNGSFDFQLATSEYIHTREKREFPLNGRFTGATFTLGARIGITDALELELRAPVRVVSYTSEPAILIPYDGDPDGALAYYQDNIVDFSQAGAGIADITIAGRYGILRNPIALAFELAVQAPTGYDGPEGTFGRDPETLEEFAEADNLVRPDNVRDDVSLGDGVLSLSANVLAGVAFSTGTFIRASAGYALRLQGAGDQFLADLRLGQSLGGQVLLYASGRLAYTVQGGKSVGISVIATDPTLPASSFTLGGNTTPIVRFLESDALDVGGGLIWKAAPTVELNLGYSRTIWGRFTTATNTLSISLAIRSNLFPES